ncbi:MAG: hypothetical protein LBH44_09530 [Treponema sp.]|jgi:hypothetical protein|nr:hypothetical protein [Treponema sp.]
MRKNLSLILLIACAASNVFSLSLDELIDPAYAARLRSDGEAITETQLKKPAPKLMPRHPALRQFVSGALSLDPNVCAETLYLYRKPVFSGSWSEAQRAQLFNQMLALSSLSGIQYYSASRKTMRTFYETSGVIDAPDTKKPVPDPVFSRPPEAFTLYARQKDLTFGDNIYRYDYQTVQDGIFFLQENLTPLNAGIITAVGKNRLRSILAVIDCGDSLLIYAVSLAKAATVLGMGDRISNSFGNRADAVIEWFSGRADFVFNGVFDGVFSDN